MKMQHIITDLFTRYNSDELSDGEMLDQLLERVLPGTDQLLANYIIEVDGDELTNEEAIQLISLRLKQLKEYT